MKEYKKFRVYQPVDLARQSLQTDYGMVFYKSEEGADWYDIQKEYSPDTLKIAYDTNGIIRSISHDVSMLTPANLSVAEVENTETNQKADIFGDWIYTSGKIQRRMITTEELIQQADEKKTELLTSAEIEISPLQRAAKFNLATDDEIKMLEAWELYSIQVSRVDTSKAPDIEWPESPV